MGLTLAKKIVEEHRGSLSLKSDEEGTVATVWIPLAQTTMPRKTRSPRWQEPEIVDVSEYPVP